MSENGHDALDLLTPEDVAALFGVKKNSISEYVRAGQLPHIHIGRHIRFRRRALEEWLTQQEERR